MKTVLASELADALVVGLNQQFALLSTLSGGLKWVKTMSELADAPVVGLNQPSASLKSTINTFRLVINAVIDYDDYDYDVLKCKARDSIIPVNNVDHLYKV